MNKNVIFYFSGTGNCLKLAKDIARELPGCEIVSMGRNHHCVLDGAYDSVGFVYPTYFVGLPLKVREFLLELDFGANKEAYIYAVTTCGRTAGNALAQAAALLGQRGMRLDYGNKIDMFSNYVVLYDMSKKVDEKTARSDKAAVPVIDDIKNKAARKTGGVNPLLEWYYKGKAKSIPAMDKGYTVSGKCVSCGICKEVCPVDNIALQDGKPVFKHHCEQCVACIQYCPERAIDYKNKTQGRGRYTNPHIGYKELGAQGDGTHA
ncbi:MAG: EFR1 family ferrodoxin [Clostridiales Family XIII bacterium]|jgi:ferredoxin/flavodoxin|nr:EFR1 family ferrodoxin [Clostridiales Family XIII bacterium]